MNWPAPGGLLVALGAALLVYLTIQRGAAARRAREWQAASADDPLGLRIAEHVRARRSRCDAWLTATAFAALALGILWLVTSRHETGSHEGVVVRGGPAQASQPASRTAIAPPQVPVLDDDPPGLTPTLLAMVGGACLALVGGALLVGLGRGPWAKGVGTAMVAFGLTANGYVVKEIKFDDLFKFETRIDKASLELEFGKRLQAISEFGPQPLGVVEDFESGRAEVRPHMRDALDRMCHKWVEHGGRRQRGLLLVIGSTDRVRLARATSSQYDSNVGLARARAEEVKARLLECDVPSSQLLTLTSGPRYTPPDASAVTAEDAAKDRSVAVWALWSVPAQQR